MIALKAWSSRHWFLLVLPVLLAISFAVTRNAAGGPVELVTLIDWCVSVPLLYFLCYRNRLSGWQMALRLLAIACAGLWVAGRLVPAAAQEILPQLGWLRGLGLAAIALVELRLLVLGVRLAFSGSADAAQLSARTGAPPFLARLMLLEARFWRWVWRLIRRR
ncbi:hypothetical protein E2493_05820 [Sphingomonas parva]|uniref:Uncharacterized protein n=1 Tax=Sphingomonas parva TaxID=2555898 RepID=A0A4Y8ZTK9_9SPHN|nr:hypothetical protein [Sphingomonas parva]TFI59353.1 hypothetical protein E2493_05820 [Sphingomonas parva]